MANPSYAQPFAPVGAAVQYEAPHGLLKLRGGHDQHDTSAFPELDKQGVSHQSFWAIGQWPMLTCCSTPLSRVLSPKRRPRSTSTGCTNGSNLSVKDSTETIDLHGVLSIYLLLQSKSSNPTPSVHENDLCPRVAEPRNESSERLADMTKGEDYSTEMVLDKNNSVGISDPNPS